MKKINILLSLILLSGFVFAKDQNRKDLELITEVSSSLNYSQTRQNIIFTRFSRPYKEGFEKDLINLYQYNSLELELFNRKNKQGNDNAQDVAISFGDATNIFNDKSLLETKVTISNLLKKDFLPNYKLYGHLHLNHDVLPFSTNLEYKANVYNDTLIQIGGVNFEKYWSDYRILIGKDFSYYHFDLLKNKGKTNSYKLEASYYRDKFSLNYAYGKSPELEIINQSQIMNQIKSHTLYTRLFLHQDFHLLAGINQSKTKTDLNNNNHQYYKTNTIWLGVKTIFK